LVWKLREHPDAFSLAKGPGRVVAKLAFPNDRVQKAECLGVLDRDVAVPNYSQDVLTIVPDHGFPTWNVQAVGSGQGNEFYVVVEPSGDDGFGGRSGILESLPQTMPRDLARVHHGSFTIGRSEVVSHKVSLLVMKCITKRLTRDGRERQ
jgi:hypothetical protein